jgi:hypothetical protein
VRGAAPKPLNAPAVGEVVRDLAAGAGVTGEIRGGSLRSGVVSSLGEHGASYADIKKVTGQKQDATVRAYDRRRPGKINVARQLGL